MPKPKIVGFKFSIAERPVHPHIKLTREPFPRVLATRMVEDDGDEYFGAFLNRTSVRILIDFLNRTFRLRTCTIAIDGSFPVPCTQYYAKRCVAPCVVDLCDREQYLKQVDLVRLFLRNDRELFLAAISRMIAAAASDLDFETAAFFRDILHEVERYWSNARWQVWLDDSVDTFELEETGDRVSVIIISQRGRRPLGEMVYTFSATRAAPATNAIPDVIAQFYRYHLPREIRVSHDFEGRTTLAKALGQKFGRKINIVVVSTSVRRVTTERALDRTRERLALDALSKKPDARKIRNDLARIFQLPSPPSRVEVFDVAHISATSFAGGVSVWKNGKDVPDEYEHWLSDRASELETLHALVSTRIERAEPDLIVVDGGRSQLKAGIAAASAFARPPRVIAAVKPKGKHMSISHFLTDDRRRIEFDEDSGAFRLLQRLRDSAHDLANSAHRLSRDMIHFYELAAMLPSLNERERQMLLREVGSIKAIADLDSEFFVTRYGKKRGKVVASDTENFRSGNSPIPQPLIVPISFVAPDGSADDLIPIASQHRVSTSADSTQP